MFNRWEPRRALAATAAAAVLAGLSAQATANTMTFEAADAGPYLQGDSLVEDGYKLTISDFMGVVDTNAGCFGWCGTNNNTRFYFGLTDSHATLTQLDGGIFRLAGFDAGYIPVVPQGAGVLPGFIQLRAITAEGSIVNKSYLLSPSDDNGSFAFQTYGGWGNPLAELGALRSVEFFACTWDSNGACANPNGYSAQFALDNIRLAPVPEPTSVALMGLGVAALLLRRRQRAA